MLVSSLKTIFICLILFSHISLRDLFISSLKASIIFIRLDLRSFSCASVVLGYPGLALVGFVGSEVVIFPWLVVDCVSLKAFQPSDNVGPWMFLC